MAKGAAAHDKAHAFHMYFDVTLTDWETKFAIGALRCNFRFDVY